MRRAVLLDDLRGVETLPDGTGTVYGIAGSAIALPRIQPSLASGDTSATLKLELLGLPASAVLSDGMRSILVSQSGQSVDLTGWDASRLSIKVPSCAGTTLQLQARATSTETSNGSTATTTQAFTVDVLSGTAVSTPATANPYVTLAASAPVTTTGTDGADVAPQIVVRTPIVTASGQLSFTAAPAPAASRTIDQIVAADQAEASVLTAEWLQELEAAAIANWSKLMGQ